MRATAALWVRLMREVLGYGPFAVHGGDWGASVTAQLAHEHAEHLIGAHMSLPVLLTVSYYGGLSPDDYGPDEQGWYEKMQARMATASAHVAVHTADPQTLAYAFNDSPAGLAAWILERRRLWSDHDGDVFDAISRDDLLAGVTLYWIGQSIGTSMRYYFEQWKQPGADRARPHARARGADRDRGVPQRPDLRAQERWPSATPTCTAGRSCRAAATSPRPRSPT